MSEQLSARQIVKDWKDGVWFKEKPDSISSRTECYDVLALTLKRYGYKLDIFTESFKHLIITGTVGNEKKKNHKDRLKAAEIYLDKMIIRHFGTVTKFIRSSEDLPSGKIDDIKVQSEDIEKNPSKSKFRDHVPDPEILEYIEQNFKFEGTEDDLK